MGKQDSKADVKRFVKIAIGSCDETRVWLEFAKDLGYLTQEGYSNYNRRYQEVGRMLSGIVKRYSS